MPLPGHRHPAWSGGWHRRTCRCLPTRHRFWRLGLRHGCAIPEPSQPRLLKARIPCGSAANGRQDADGSPASGVASVCNACHARITFGRIRASLPHAIGNVDFAVLNRPRRGGNGDRGGGARHRVGQYRTVGFDAHGHMGRGRVDHAGDHRQRRSALSRCHGGVTLVDGSGTTHAGADEYAYSLRRVLVAPGGITPRTFGCRRGESDGERIGGYGPIGWRMQSRFVTAAANPGTVAKNTALSPLPA